MEISLKDMIPIITLLGALIVFHIKAFYNFFMSIIKMNYKEFPGKQPIFDILIQWIAYIGCLIYMIVALPVIIFDNPLKERVSKLNDPIEFTGFILALFLLIALIDCFIRFINIQIIFRKKMKGRPVCISRYMELRNGFGIFVFIIYTSISLVFILMDIIKNINFTNGTYILFENHIVNKESAIAFILEILFGTLLLICLNLKEIIKSLKSNDLYILYFDEEEIYCSCYLEFKDYYLVIKNENERYINKSKVKEIRKVKNNQENNYLI